MSTEDLLILSPLVVVIAITLMLGVTFWALYRRWLAHEQLDEIHRRERLRILLRQHTHKSQDTENHEG